MRIYLDACCLSRLTDDQSQSRIRDEAEGVENILRMVRQELAIWISSSVLSLEISRNPDPERRRSTEALLAFASETFIPDNKTAEIARRIEKLSITPFDALHLAIADQSGSDVFLTTDDNLLRRARRGRDLLRVNVQNPVSWIGEMPS